MVDFQERDTRRNLRDDDSGDEADGSDGSNGEAEIDQVRQQLEERPGGDDDTAGQDPDGESGEGDAEQPEAEPDGHDHESDHDHHHHDVESLGAAVVTVSTSRTLADDPSGDYIVQSMVDAGHDVVTRELIPDDYDDVQHTVDTLVRRDDVDVVVSTGGTGVTPDDCTIEAVRPLFDKELPGFGELFRRRSQEEIGTRIVGTRATAGVADGVPVFCLPGSRNAAELGVDEIIVEEAPHLAGLAKRDHEGHDHEKASQETGSDHEESAEEAGTAAPDDSDVESADASVMDEESAASASDPIGESGAATSEPAGRSDGGRDPVDEDDPDWL